MFRHILFFDLKLRFKKMSTYIYFSLFLLLGFMAIWRGSYGSGLLSKLTNAGTGNVMANAPYALHYFFTFVSNYGIMICAFLFGSAAYRDFNENIYSVYFSYPVTKTDYVAGRFLAAFITAAFIFTGVGTGALIASIFPVLTNPEKIAEINLYAYLNPYLTTILPNIFVAGSIFYTIVLLSRKFIAVYSGLIFILVCHILGISLLQSSSSKISSFLIDPFGHLAARNIYIYWSAAQKNLLLIPFSGDLMVNRIFWLVISAFVCFIALKKFQFSQVVESKRKKIKITGSIRLKIKNRF